MRYLIGALLATTTAVTVGLTAAPAMAATSHAPAASISASGAEPDGGGFLCCVK